MKRAVSASYKKAVYLHMDDAICHLKGKHLIISWHRRPISYISIRLRQPLKVPVSDRYTFSMVLDDQLMKIYHAKKILVKILHPGFD